MKDFNQLRKDFVGDPELADVLNGCNDVDDIKNGFAEKGYEVTDKDIDDFVEEKLPMLLEEYPELKEQFTETSDTELNGALNLAQKLGTSGSGAGVGAAIGGVIGGPIGAGIGGLIGGLGTFLSVKNC